MRVGTPGATSAQTPMKFSWGATGIAITVGALSPVSFFILLVSNPRRTPLTHRGWDGRF